MLQCTLNGGQFVKDVPLMGATMYLARMAIRQSCPLDGDYNIPWTEGNSSKLSPWWGLQYNVPLTEGNSSKLSPWWGLYNVPWTEGNSSKLSPWWDYNVPCRDGNSSKLSPWWGILQKTRPAAVGSSSSMQENWWFVCLWRRNITALCWAWETHPCQVLKMY